MPRHLIPGLLIFLCATSAYSAEPLTIPDGFFSVDARNGQWLLAENTAAAPSAARASVEPAMPQAVYEERLFTANTVHKYLGLGSILLAGLTVIAPKEDGDSLHHQLGEGAAILGVGAVATGLVFHWEDIHLASGLKDPDNLHLILGTLGTAGYLMASSAAPDSPHPTYGVAGAVSMATAIKLTW